MSPIPENRRNFGGKHFSDFAKVKIWRLSFVERLTAKQISEKLWKDDKVRASWRGIRKLVLRSSARGHFQTKKVVKRGPEFSKEDLDTITDLVKISPHTTALKIQDVLANSGTLASISTINRARRYCGFDPVNIKYCQVKYNGCSCVNIVLLVSNISICF